MQKMWSKTYADSEGPDYCPLKDLLDITESMNWKRKQKPGW